VSHAKKSTTLGLTYEVGVTKRKFQFSLDQFYAHIVGTYVSMKLTELCKTYPVDLVFFSPMMPINYVAASRVQLKTFQGAKRKNKINKVDSSRLC
jgi:hypothetical protein